MLHCNIFMFLWLTFVLSHICVYSREVDEEILNKLKHFEIEMSILRGSNENLKDRLVVLENQNTVLKQDNENRKTENIILKQEFLGMKLKMDAAIASSDAVSTSAVDGQDVFTHNDTHHFPSPATFTRDRKCGLKLLHCSFTVFKGQLCFVLGFTSYLRALTTLIFLENMDKSAAFKAEV